MIVKTLKLLAVVTLIYVLGEYASIPLFKSIINAHSVSLIQSSLIGVLSAASMWLIVYAFCQLEVKFRYIFPVALVYAVGHMLYQASLMTPMWPNTIHSMDYGLKFLGYCLGGFAFIHLVASFAFYGYMLVLSRYAKDIDENLNQYVEKR